jgi:cytochrome P450
MSEADPALNNRDDRKSAAIAAANACPQRGAIVTGKFFFARDILRAGEMRQHGAGAEHIKLDNPDHVSVFFLDGELHKKRRTQLARYFTPKAINERHRLVMERTTAELIAKLRHSGRERLDLMSFDLACDVAAEIVGLTNSNPRKMSGRILSTFGSIGGDPGKGLARLIKGTKALWRTGSFFWNDIRPAIAARRVQPREDVISYMVQENYSNKATIIECMTYATAGMLTTREYIVMVAWHLFENAELRQRFLEGDEDVQFAILDEILRLEPVAAFVHRKAAETMTGSNGEQVQPGEVYAIDIRAANTDEAITGACPFAIDPERSKRQKMPSSWMSFADGPHRCPGSQVALHETRVFIDALLRVPGIRLANAPTLGWCAPIMGYELHGAYVECDRG